MKMRKSILLAIVGILVLVMAGCGVSEDDYNSLHSQLTQTEQELASLQQEVSQQEEELGWLNTSNEELRASNNSLELQLISSQAEVSALSLDLAMLNVDLAELNYTYTVLQGSYNTLQAQYTSLCTAQQISDALRIGHLLAGYYGEVRDAHSDSSSWGSTATLQDKVDFAANLAQHGLGEVYWVAWEDTYYNLAGEYSYTTAWRELNEVLSLIGIASTDTTTQKIDKILDFINAHISYESDFNEAYMAPMETLGFLSGDCDDYAILAATLFEAVGIESAVGFFYNGVGYHAMTLVHVDSLSPYGCYYYSDLTSLGLQAGKWVIIEPQTTIENQHTEWVHQWNIQVAAEV